MKTIKKVELTGEEFEGYYLEWHIKNLIKCVSRCDLPCDLEVAISDGIVSKAILDSHKLLDKIQDATDLYVFSEFAKKKKVDEVWFLDTLIYSKEWEEE